LRKDWGWKDYNSSTVTHWAEMMEFPEIDGEQKRIIDAYERFTSKNVGVKISVDQFVEIWKCVP
jgi:hypothetical protein